jgi:hypothetical protein
MWSHLLAYLLELLQKQRAHLSVDIHTVTWLTSCPYNKNNGAHRSFGTKPLGPPAGKATKTTGIVTKT